VRRERPPGLLDAPAAFAAVVRALGTILDVPLVVATSDQAVELEELSRLESEAFSRLAGSLRLPSWLRGRAALKRLLRALDEPDDTGLVRFPHPRLSLTHAGALAIAVGTRHQRLDVTGVGVDLEWARAVRPEASRFYLQPEEMLELQRLTDAEANAARLRLWTVKEALFKATPQNENALLTDVSCADPLALTGTAWGKRAERYAYATQAFGAGVVTVAVSYLA